MNDFDDIIFSPQFIQELSKDDEKWMRDAFFVIPETKEDLHDWIELYLGLDFPDAIVDELSNSSPMDMIWEVYNKARLNNDPDFHRVLFYAARDSAKTLASAVLEVLMMVLLRRNVSHIAAILDQSRKAKQYVKSFFSKPIIRDYVTSMSERYTEFTHPDGLVNSLQILVMTLQGTNFEHTSYVSLDELDVVRNPEAYKELAFVASPRDGQLPITLLTSSRKWSFGLVQAEIDNASKSGLAVRHWNILDVTEACPAARCRPDLPQVTIFRSEQDLTAISEEAYKNLPEDRAKHYVKDTGFAGCLNNCKMFAICRTRLHTHQTSRSPLLKPLSHVQNLFGSTDLEKAKAQLLCWKPSSEGLILTTLSDAVQRKTPAQIAYMIDAEERPPNFSKAELIDLIVQKVKEGALTLFAGIDWGFTHNFAVVLGVETGAKQIFITECVAMPGLELDQVVDITEKLFNMYGGKQSVLIYPDNAYPAYIKTFRKRGFRCKDFKKDVQGGIESIRFGLRDALSITRLYFLKDDTGVDLLWRYMLQYHWQLDAAGRTTDTPEEDNTDEIDALRYLCQNRFNASRPIIISTHQATGPFSQAPVDTLNYNNYLSETIRNKLQDTAQQSPSKGQSGSIFWDFSDETEEIRHPVDIIKHFTKR